MALTPTRTASSRRQAVLTAIRQHFRERGQSPSYREIAARVGGGFRARHVASHLEQLAASGILTHRPGVGRSIELVDRGAALSDLELEAACHGRGWTVTRPPAVAVPAVEAFPVEAALPPDAIELLNALDQLPPV